MRKRSSLLFETHQLSFVREALEAITLHNFTSIAGRHGLVHDQIDRGLHCSTTTIAVDELVDARMVAAEQATPIGHAAFTCRNYSHAPGR